MSSQQRTDGWISPQGINPAVLPSSQERKSTIPHHGWFDTTHWSVVLGAAQEDPTRRMAALEKLCRSYWRPVCEFIRHSGHEIHDAQDLTQTFFAELLRRNALRNLEPGKGKFRSFLLVLLRHFLTNQAKRSAAAKRGRGQIPVPLDPNTQEEPLFAAKAGELTAEEVFDRHWALAALDRAFASLRAEFERNGENARFEQLKVFLSREGRGEDYAKAAAPLGLTASAIKVAVHRLRHRYGELLREEVAQTVESRIELEAEMRYLLELLIH
jgi:RNA polymerase sigma factor (sigma-70 family)